MNNHFCVSPTSSVFFLKPSKISVVSCFYKQGGYVAEGSCPVGDVDSLITLFNCTGTAFHTEIFQLCSPKNKSRDQLETYFCSLSSGGWGDKANFVKNFAKQIYECRTRNHFYFKNCKPLGNFLVFPFSSI